MEAKTETQPVFIYLTRWLWARLLRFNTRLFPPKSQMISRMFDSIGQLLILIFLYDRSRGRKRNNYKRSKCMQLSRLFWQQLVYRDQEPKKVDGGYLINGVLYAHRESGLFFIAILIMKMNRFISLWRSTSRLNCMRIESLCLLANRDLCFSEESLENNLFLRKYMDQEGYLPVTILCYIPAIQM